jgi:hypothetical protein
MCAMRPSPNGFWLPVCIAKVIGIFDHRVTSMPRLAFEGLEPYDGNLSRTVLRGLGVSNDPRLPGVAVFLFITFFI